MLSYMVDWMPIITAGIAIAGTLLGTLFTSVLSARSERQRREADTKREIEAARESRETQAREADAAVSKEIAELLLKGRRHVRQYDIDVDGAFDDYFDNLWGSGIEEELRMTVGRVRDDEARSRLITVMDALLDYQPLAPFSGSLNTEDFVDDTFLLGAELALAVSRGKQPENINAQRFDLLKNKVDQWDEFLEHQAQERAQRERERLRREARKEELHFEAMMDLPAQSLEEEGEDA